MDMIYKNQIIKCLNNIGIFLENDDELMNLNEFIEDSLAFIMFIVEIEQTFEIEIPDEYLSMDAISSIDAVNNMIENLIKK